MEKQGILFIVSGPAGSGKGTVVSELRKIMPDVGVSVSATTRAPRPGEVCGVNYHFTTRADFEGKIAAGEVLEYTEYLGNYYGTLRSEVERLLGEGRDVILEIEVEGAAQIKRSVRISEQKETAVKAFVMYTNPVEAVIIAATAGLKYLDWDIFRGRSTKKHTKHKTTETIYLIYTDRPPNRK